MASDGSGDYPVAYCAPGQHFAAALTLALKGEQVERIREHPWLEGRTDVLVMRRKPELFIDLAAFRIYP
jgi:hypothetical protein